MEEEVRDIEAEVGVMDQVLTEQDAKYLRGEVGPKVRKVRWYQDKTIDESKTFISMNMCVGMDIGTHLTMHLSRPAMVQNT